LDGEVFAAELHVVHKEPGGTFAVLGYFVEPTATVTNPIFDQILKELDEVSDAVSEKCGLPVRSHWWQVYQEDVDAAYDDVPFNVYDLMPEGSAIYNYDGGLTTPPCTETVLWNVVEKPVKITPAQYTDLMVLILNYVNDETCEYATIANPLSGSTSRPTQPLNGRTVTRICPTDYVEEPASFDEPVIAVAAQEPILAVGKTVFDIIVEDPWSLQTVGGYVYYA